MTQRENTAAAAIRGAVRSRLATRPCNQCDPITLEELPPAPFILISEGPDRHVPIGYDPAALRAYLEATHAARDPVLLKTLNPVELNRLARATGGARVRVSSLEREAQLRRQDIAVAMERAAGPLLDGLMCAIEQGDLRGFDRAFPEQRKELLSMLSTCARNDAETFEAFSSNARGRLSRLKSQLRLRAKRRCLVRLEITLAQVK